MKEAYDPVQILAKNLRELIAHEKRKSRPANSVKAVARLSGVGNGTVGRARKGTHALGIDNLQEIAKVFGLRAWQLLVPDLQPGNPPLLQQLSEAEAGLYTRFKSLAKEVTQTVENK